MKSANTVPRLLALLLLAGCGESAADDTIVAGEREIRPVTDVVAQVGGPAQDSALLRPTSLAFAGTDVIVWDDGRSAVLAFAPDGRLRWSYGREGGGPGEFAGVNQLAVDEQGRIWLLDARNARVTILRPDGTLFGSSRLPANFDYVDRLAPIGGGRALLMGTSPTVHVIDDSGRPLESRPHPYGAYASLHPIAAYNRAVRDQRTDSLAFFFYYGGGFLPTDGALSTVPELTGYIEPIPLPEVTIETTTSDDGTVTRTSSVNAQRLAVRSASADGGVLHVLFQGDTEYGDRVVDRYAIGSGDYLGSWLLPDSARAIAVKGDLIATLEENPVPTLVIRRTPGS